MLQAQQEPRWVVEEGEAPPAVLQQQQVQPLMLLLLLQGLQVVPRVVTARRRPVVHVRACTWRHDCTFHCGKHSTAQRSQQQRALPPLVDLHPASWMKTTGQQHLLPRDWQYYYCDGVVRGMGTREAAC